MPYGRETKIPLTGYINPYRTVKIWYLKKILGPVILPTSMVC
jgi:hypothetical protein